MGPETASVQKRIVWSECAECFRKTNHDVVCEHHEDGGEHYNCDYEYSVVKCRGCGHCSFRYVFNDYEQGYPDNDGEGWEYPKTVENYPRSLNLNNEVANSWHVPELVGEVYGETLTAIKEGASILAGLGLRGTIEAICNDQKVTGKNLEVRISRLAQQGLISQKDAGRLNAIRFLGNDAAHEIKKASKKQIDTALKIVEHMILTVYVLDEEARQNLDYLIDQYIDFENLILKKIEEFSTGDEFPLAKFLGKDVRRIPQGITHFESMLIAKISSGEFTRLSVGKNDPFSNSQVSLQHFVIK